MEKRTKRRNKKKSPRKKKKVKSKRKKSLKKNKRVVKKVISTNINQETIFKTKSDWVKTTPEQINELIVEMDKEGLSPSQIGIKLRNEYAIPSAPALANTLLKAIDTTQAKNKPKNPPSTDAAAEAVYGPCGPILLHYNPILLHSSSIWLLLLVLMLLLKLHMALGALYCSKTATKTHGSTNLVNSVFTTRQRIKLHK